MTMFKKMAPLAFSFLALSAAIPAHAEFDDSCFVQVAFGNNVAHYDAVSFNVVSDEDSRSVTLNSGDSPTVLDKLSCSSTAWYQITATPYSIPKLGVNLIKEIPAIGTCKLTAGLVPLKLTNNSVSVVFPDDFTCPK